MLEVLPPDVQCPVDWPLMTSVGVLPPDVQGPVDWPLVLLDGLQTASVVDQRIGCISEGRGRMAAAG